MMDVRFLFKNQNLEKQKITMKRYALSTTYVTNTLGVQFMSTNMEQKL